MLRSLVSQEKGTFPSQTGKSHFILVSSLQLNKILLIYLFKINDPVGNICCVVSPVVLRAQMEQNGSAFYVIYLLFFRSQETLGMSSSASGEMLVQDADSRARCELLCCTNEAFCGTRLSLGWIEQWESKTRKLASVLSLKGNFPP